MLLNILVKILYKIRTRKNTLTTHICLESGERNIQTDREFEKLILIIRCDNKQAGSRS